MKTQLKPIPQILQTQPCLHKVCNFQCQVNLDFGAKENYWWTPVLPLNNDPDHMKYSMVILGFVNFQQGSIYQSMQLKF